MPQYWANSSGQKVAVVASHGIILYSMPNSWSKHAYAQGFDCEFIYFKKAVNIFERTEIAESFYEGVIGTSYKKSTRADANRDGQSRKNRGESASSWTRPKKGESAGKSRKHTCLIHGPGYSSEERKVLGDFGTKYANSRPTKDRGSSPVPRKKNSQQENNSIVNNIVDAIILNEIRKVCATNHE